jgi:hypothetical protein
VLRALQKARDLAARRDRRNDPPHAGDAITSRCTCKGLEMRAPRSRPAKASSKKAPRRRRRPRPRSPSETPRRMRILATETPTAPARCHAGARGFSSRPWP